LARARRNDNRLDWDCPDEGSSGIIRSDDPEEQEFFAELEAWDARDPSSPLSLKGPPQPDTFDDSPPGPSPKIPFGGVDWSELEDNSDEESAGLRVASYVYEVPRQYHTSPVPPSRRLALEGALEAGRWFRLKHPELVGAVMEYEMSWASPSPSHPWLTDSQDALAEVGLPIGGTFGPAQFNPQTIIDIENEFIERRAEISNDIREHLLPLIEGDYYQALRRSLDPHWTRLYLAAWIYLWELDNPNDPIGFVLRKWNPSSGRLNPKAPFASKYYAPGWKKSGPRLLEKWRQKDRSYNR